MVGKDRLPIGVRVRINNADARQRAILTRTFHLLADGVLKESALHSVGTLGAFALAVRSMRAQTTLSVLNSSRYRAAMAREEAEERRVRREQARQQRVARQAAADARRQREMNEAIGL
jgi:hypothetical protein